MINRPPILRGTIGPKIRLDKGLLLVVEQDIAVNDQRRGSEGGAVGLGPAPAALVDLAVGKFEFGVDPDIVSVGVVFGICALDEGCVLFHVGVDL
jgi:hypothetical protein